MADDPAAAVASPVAMAAPPTPDDTEPLVPPPPAPLPPPPASTMSGHSALRREDRVATDAEPAGAPQDPTDAVMFDPLLNPPPASEPSLSQFPDPSSTPLVTQTMTQRGGARTNGQQKYGGTYRDEDAEEACSCLPPGCLPGGDARHPERAAPYSHCAHTSR